MKSGDHFLFLFFLFSLIIVQVTRQLPSSPGGGMSPQFDPSQIAQGMSEFADPAKMANKVADGIQKMQQMIPMGGGSGKRR